MAKYGNLKANNLIYNLDDGAGDISVPLNNVAGKAPLASPALTGTPTAPTAAADTNTTQIATTAYVQTELGDYLTTALGAPKADPTFTGTVAGPTINASTALQIGGVAITSTAAELNILDGVTSTATELNLLDGKTVVGDAVLANDQTWTGAQRGTVTALTDASTIAVDFNSSNNFSVTLAGNRELGQPSNQVVGQSGSIFITQDGTGSRTLSYHADWDFAGGTAPTISSAANAVDRIDYIVAAANKIHAVATLDVK